jgi:hypothetical protein
MIKAVATPHRGRKQAFETCALWTHLVYTDQSQKQEGKVTERRPDFICFGWQCQH